MESYGNCPDNEPNIERFFEQSLAHHTYEGPRINRQTTEYIKESTEELNRIAGSHKFQIKR